MAKKTKAGGKKRNVAAKSTQGPPSSGGWAGGDRYNSKFMDHKKSDGKFKPVRIAKKRG